LVIFGIIVLFLWNVTAITHTYGPYMGKVVDAETGEPIEGAVVFFVFFTAAPNPGGSSTKVAHAVEVLTDIRGEFSIPAQKITLFRFLHGWEKDGFVTIFKPGYGAFPGHSDSGPKYEISYSLPENTYWTVKLPKLKSFKEKKDNLGNLFIPGSEEIPLHKRKLILDLHNEERRSLGFGPVSR
jgi:hypothetical protein